MKAITGFLKKWWWLIGLAIVGYIFRATVFSFLQWILVVALVGGIIYFLYKIPGVRSWFTGLKGKPILGIVICGILLLVVIATLIFPNLWPSTPETPHQPQPTHTAQPSEQPNGQQPEPTAPSQTLPALTASDVRVSYAVNAGMFEQVAVYTTSNSALENPVVVNSSTAIDFSMKAIPLNGQQFSSGVIMLTTMSTGGIQQVWDALNSNSEHSEFTRTTIECLPGETYLYEYTLNGIKLYLALKVVQS